MTKYLKPFPDSQISSKYGFRSLAGGTFHEGIDYRLAMNTPLPALAAGVVVGVGETKKFGKYVAVRADVGGIYRWHAADGILVAVGARVRAGDIIARSGMSGFWSTGPHGHLQCTLLLTPNSHINPLTVLSGSAGAGTAAKPLPQEEEDDMFTEDDRTKQNNIYAALWNGGSVIIDGKVQKFNYGVLPIVVETQRRLAVQSGQIAALSAAVSAVSGGTPINLTAIEAAAEKGAREALEDLTFKATVS